MNFYFLPINKSKILLTLSLILGFSIISYAQPANDNCDAPTAMTLAPDEASIVFIDGTTVGTVDALGLPAPSVCSGGWFRDDVWFSFTLGAEVPGGGITVQLEYTGANGDLVNNGMAVYTNDCDPSNAPINCFSDAPGVDFMNIPSGCLAPNETYLVRIWSPGVFDAGAGTFRIGAFEVPGMSTGPAEIVYYEEDFNNGLNGWTSLANSSSPIGNNEPHEWIYAADGVFSTFGGGTQSIAHPTSACGGSVGMPAGWYQTYQTGNPDTIGATYQDIDAELISPTLDLSGISDILSLQFTQRVQRLNPNAGGADGVWASYSVSIDDGATWEGPFTLNGDLDINSATTTTPPRDNIVQVKIPVEIAGQPAVKIKFQWQCDFYYWIIDNVKLVQAEPHNMRTNPFFARALNYSTPASQIESFGFLADIENIGSATQSNVNLNVTITDDASGTVVYSEDKDYGMITADSLAENQLFDLTYTPPATPATYSGVYSVTADSTDADLNDNAQEFSFEVTNSLFAKETGPATQSFRYNVFDANNANSGDDSYMIGNHYHLPNGGNYYLQDVTFGLTYGGFAAPDLSDSASVAGRFINLYVYKLNIDARDSIGLDDREQIAFASYTLIGNEENNLITIPASAFTNIANPGDEHIHFEDGGDYLIMGQVVHPTPGTGSFVFWQVNEDINYSATILRQNELATPRYGSFIGEGATATTEAFTALSASDSPAAIMRMNIEEDLVSTKDLLSADNSVRLFPNPVSNVLNVQLDLVDPANQLMLEITDLTGKLLLQKDYGQIQNETVTIDVKQFPVGTYFLTVRTNEGSKTERFVIQK